jgi:cold shock CspA family protein
MQGIVVHYNQARGFGFIYSDELQRRVFFHASHVTGTSVAQVNHQCTFELAAGKPGLPEQAVKVLVAPLAGLDVLRRAKWATVAGTQVLRTEVFDVGGVQ